MSMLLEQPLLREAAGLGADGFEGTDTADPIAEFAASQLEVVRGLPAATLLAPIEAEVDDESDEDEAEAREEGPAATSAEADDGTSPGDYSAQHTLASGRLHAARAEAAALSQALDLLRSRRHLLPTALTAPPPPIREAEDEPALQLRRARALIGGAARALSDGADGLASRLSAEQRLCEEVAALRSHWRVVGVDSVGEMAETRPRHFREISGAYLRGYLRDTSQKPLSPFPFPKRFLRDSSEAPPRLLRGSSEAPRA
eukprot:CAMPEP_0185505940 /NCGR_PEP_ID=MMETSP1366-20130426/38282_1 /TAXON_ID=38817 /ORGANISM="Gephyrocapsa oceanica, Strain RCC1303" /LENGTH=257 /DNA_ID=CAMNT_0028116057 /DNA_START=9 /DNA_END=779 /DNA_ORIENTATION=+